MRLNFSGWFSKPWQTASRCSLLVGTALALANSSPWGVLALTIFGGGCQLKQSWIDYNKKREKLDKFHRNSNVRHLRDTNTFASRTYDEVTENNKFQTTLNKYQRRISITTLGISTLLPIFSLMADKSVFSNDKDKIESVKSILANIGLLINLGNQILSDAIGDKLEYLDNENDMLMKRYDTMVGAPIVASLERVALSQIDKPAPEVGNIANPKLLIAHDAKHENAAVPMEPIAPERPVMFSSAAGGVINPIAKEQNVAVTVKGGVPKA